MSAMPAALAERARAVALTLRASGHRAWLVGGCVRDLALGVEPKDCDMASAATPDEVERLFPRTYAVGKAFGTIVVHLDGGDVQVTTFRSETAYRDARRPDAVAWGASPQEDSRRRDFTCNALYLDPVTDEVLDPQGGLGDLERRVLRCVGDAAGRFREDGLRIVRLARFAAAYGLEVEPATFDAARTSLDALAGVSPERLLVELALIFERRRPWIALRLLHETGALRKTLPGVEELRPARLAPAEAMERKLRALEALGDAPGVAPGWCVLLDPRLGEREVGADRLAAATAPLDGLRPSHALRTSVVRLIERSGAVAALARAGEEQAARSARVRLVRDECWPVAVRIARAWRTADGAGMEDLDRLEAWGRALSRADLWPQPMLTTGDIAAAGIPRGPAWRRLLDDAERLQLDLAWRSRDDALAWLAARAAELVK